ncbi:aminotransferase class V-fold PLP-dependent enzyme [Haloechinothrix salitolerans]|uniref:Aminotransferase class V-fold PLP-dependent enzyme n=1 Tax=Haloechinothrix salitolerans TaxID=926830 RepID=A0ABW2BY30_9PSEU
MDLREARRLFDPEPGWLNTASYGLPPRPAWTALQEALDDWRHGRTSWEPWAEATERARASFARLVGASPGDIAVSSAVSQQVGLVAAALPAGARVLVPEMEFTSNLFPYYVQRERGVIVETVPLADLLDRIDDRVDVVALSVVQSATGEVTDLATVAARARGAGARVVVDATQAVGWHKIDVAHVDALVCAAYKWLCAPRGTSFCYLAQDLREQITPHAAGWYAGADVHASYYGPEMKLASDARRFDLSPAWHCWVGAAPALELIEQVGVAAIGEYDVGLANGFRAGLGLPPGDSAIVSLGADVIPHDADQRPAEAGIRAAARAGSLRASFHLYTTEADVDAAVEALS